MKKVLILLVFVMCGIVVNAQRTPVRTADLQKPILDNITKDYPGFVIKDAFRVESGNSVKYEVGILKGKTTETLVYDKDGKFINKMAMKTSSAMHKSASSSQAHKPSHKTM